MISDARKTVSVVFGTRPEAIKLAPVVLALRDHPSLKPHVCVTAQHRSMLDQVLETFGIVPDRDLDLMQPGQSLAAFTSRAIEAVDRYFADARPALVLAQGDTTTVAAAALCAFYRRIPVGHVEAGLRTWNRWSPFPEEMNRVLTARLADWHFAPTAAARENLLAEGVKPDTVIVTGNTVIDALQIAVSRLRESPVAIPGLAPEVLRDGPRVVLVTGHRRENFGAAFEAICRALAALATRFPDTQVIYPVHLNPRVREPVHRLLAGIENVHLLEPLEYLPFVALMQRATLILTDSGGVQEEAPSLGKPVLVMRDTTERPEVVAAGAARLVGADTDRIVAEASRLLSDPAALDAMSRTVNPYGDGRAAQRIVATCAHILRA